MASCVSVILAENYSAGGIYSRRFKQSISPALTCIGEANADDRAEVSSARDCYLLTFANGEPAMCTRMFAGIVIFSCGSHCAATRVCSGASRRSHRGLIVKFKIS